MRQFETHSMAKVFKSALHVLEDADQDLLASDNFFSRLQHLCVQALNVLYIIAYVAWARHWRCEEHARLAVMLLLL